MCSNRTHRYRPWRRVFGRWISTSPWYPRRCAKACHPPGCAFAVLRSLPKGGFASLDRLFPPRLTSLARACRVLQWLLLAFLNGLPTDTTLRIWDLFFVAGPRVLLAASVAAVHVLDGKLKDADGSFEESTLAEHAAPMHYNDAETLPRNTHSVPCPTPLPSAYMVLKNELPLAALDDDLFVRRTLEALHELPAERVRDLRARHRVGIMAETAEREARMRERRMREHDKLHAGGNLNLALKALRTHRKQAPVRLLSAALCVLLVALGIGRYALSSPAHADAGADAGAARPWRSCLSVDSYAAMGSVTCDVGCAVLDGEGGCRRHHSWISRSWPWPRHWPRPMHKVRSLLRSRRPGSTTTLKPLLAA